MKLVPAVFLALLTMHLACSPPSNPEMVHTQGAVAAPPGTATPSAADVSAARVTRGAAIAPTATATSRVTAIPTATPVPTPTGTPSTTATPSAAAAPTATPVPTPKGAPSDAAALTATDPIVRIKLPIWVEESPRMASYIASSDIIAKAKFVSLDSTTQQHPVWGYAAELIYTFEVVQYLKGDGDDSLVVRLSSGPKYIAFPDWLSVRTESEARELAEEWLSRRRQTDRIEGDSILFLLHQPENQAYFFRGYESGQGHGGHPFLEKTWLVEDGSSMYRHQFTGEPTTISLSDLNARIEDIQRFMEGEHSACVVRALSLRSWVRERILGTYRELTVGGYRTPEDFPQLMTDVGSETTADTEVLRLTRPPYKSPRFSHHWLDGKDKDLFSIVVDANDRYTTEGLRALNPLPAGRYSVHYSQFHRSLPCDRQTYEGDDVWWVTDTVEWIINVTQ